MGIVEMISLGLGLAMDASAVSMVDGFNNSNIKLKKSCFIAFLFAFFQCLMPLLGYFIAHTILFNIISKFAPYVALIVLGFIGIKMLLEGLKKCDECDCIKKLCFKLLVLQAIATSIDALSVGLVFASYEPFIAVEASIIIGLVTFSLSLASIYIGKKFGTIFQNKAQVLGGIILVLIGLFIFLKGIL